MERRIEAKAANWLFFIFVCAFFIFQITTDLLIDYPMGHYFADNIYATVIVNELIIVLLPVLIFVQLNKYSFKTLFRLNSFSMKAAFLICLISIFAYITANMLNNITYYFLQKLGDLQGSQFPVPQSLHELITSIIIVGILPAVCEEMLNRGIILNAYEERGTYKAIIISAVFFGIFHFNVTNLLGPVFLGALMGIYMVRTNSIFAAMLAHFLNNTIDEVLSYLYRGDIVASTQMSTSDLGAALIYFVMALGIVLFLLNIFVSVTKSTCIIKPSTTRTRNDVKEILLNLPLILSLIIYVLSTALYLVIITNGAFY